MRDPFGVLGVAHDASAAEIDEAWRTRMRRLHPDANPGAGETELRRLTALAAEVNDAHARLRNNLAAERARWSPAQPGAPTSPGLGSDTPVLLPVRIPGGNLFRRPLTWAVLTVALVIGLLLLNQVGNPALGRGSDAVDDSRGESRLGEQVARAFQSAVTRGDDDDDTARVKSLADERHGTVGVSDERGDRR